jgi:hypothetical protein
MGVLDRPLYTGLIAGDPLDFDGGVVAVPKTDVATTLLTFSSGGPFYIEWVNVSVFDAAAVPYVSWTLLIDGVPLPPWSGMRLPGAQMVNEYQIMRDIAAVREIKIMGIVAATSPSAVDVLGRLKGFYLSRPGTSSPYYHRRPGRSS